jgi:pimeloyl-ACP methyl ester carboxylesterase
MVKNPDKTIPFTYLLQNLPMNNVRTYGKAPYRVAVIHGGPGAPGEMAPVARELAGTCGVIEPLQTAATLEGQLQELQTVLDEYGTPSITLIGFSWGAILSFMFTARHPHSIKKLIMIGSGVFKDRYAADITRTRLYRLSADEQRSFLALSVMLNDQTERHKDRIFAELGQLFSRTDTYDPLTLPDEVIAYQYEIFRNVWSEAEELRKSGQMLAPGTQISCPVVAIHGDYDPHPADGVRIPLSRVLGDFRFILLAQCGHRPWIERAARDRFFQILLRELGE